ncbi:MAG TPA: hypothetical protein VF824_14080 [Thermoanaerobaculia bacterium]
MRVAIVAALLVAVAAHADVVQVTVEVRNGGTLGSGALRVRDVASKAEPRVIPLEQGVARIDNAANATLEVELAVDGWWSPQRIVTAGTSAIALPVWRTGVVTGSFAAPAEVTLSVEAPPDETSAIERGTTFSCTTSGARWSCNVPATELDLVVRPSGFAPHYAWGVKVAPAKTTSLGTLPLREGASVIAWLATKQRGLPARARLVRAANTSAGAGFNPALLLPVAEADFSKRGAVQLVPVPPGVYTLEVLANGFAPAHAFPIEVYESRETSLRRGVELRPPLTLRVAVTPPLDPYGKRWTIAVERQNDFGSGGELAAVQQADERGALALAGRSAGRYVLRVKDSRANAWFYDDWFVTSEADAQKQVALESLEVEGTVTHGHDPLAATLHFGGRYGAVRIDTTSDADGAFHVTLPRGGKWPVQVVAGTLDTIVSVVVPERGKQLALHVPKTVVAGAVIGANGELVPGARVTLLVPNNALPTRADEHGRFRFEGVPFGRTQIMARRGDDTESTPWIPLELTPETAVQDRLELELIPTRILIGQVMSQGRPVAGAAVNIWPLHVDHSGANTVTDRDGRFSVRLPETTRRIAAVVAAPGNALQTFETDIGSRPPVFELTPHGGTIELALPPGYEGLQVTQDAQTIAHVMRNWAVAHGEPLDAAQHLRIPDVAPGVIRACVTVDGAQRCSEGQLAAGAVLRLDLDR